MTSSAGQEPAVVRVNDNLEVPWSPGMTVRDLLRQCRFTYSLITVSVNGQVIRREEYDTYPIPPGAEVRVIHLIAGG